MNETTEPDRRQEPDGDDMSDEGPADDKAQPVSPTGDEVRDAVTTSPEAVVEQPAPRSRGRGLAILALLLALVGVGTAGYVGWLQRLAAVGADGARADLTGEVNGIRNATDTMRDDVQSLTRDVEQIRGRGVQLDTDMSQLGRRVTDAELAVASVENRDRTPSDNQWVKKEIEHLLRIANQRLTLAQDADTALAALLAADRVTASAGDPGLQPVRRQLADDILALRSVEQPDVEGLALRLASLARRVSDLPLSGQPRPIDEAGAPASDSESGFARLRRKIGEFFSSIFSVRQTSGEAGPLLSRDQAFFLRRNLELELQSARVALLSADAPVYRASIGAARRWTEQYFDNDDPGVSGFVDALREIENRRISVVYPDVSGALRVLLQTAATGQPTQ